MTVLKGSCQKMGKHIVIIGGGVIGLSTAWVLIKNGHQVHMLEREQTPGLVTSFANGGQLSYRYVAPLADRGVPLQGLKWMGKADSPLNLRLRMSVSQWQWLMQFILACNRNTHQVNSEHLLRLSLFSKQVMQNWLDEGGLANFDWHRSGKLVVHRKERAFDNAASNTDPKFQQVLNAEECVKLEPALTHIARELRGGIYSPGDETADCQKFCRALLEQLNLSGNFKLTTGCEVQKFQRRENFINAVLTTKGKIEGEEFVVAAGNGSRKLLGETDVSVPLYPLQGYSLTMPYPAPGIAPSVSVTDYDHKIVYARLGDRLRIAAMVDIGYAESGLRPQRLSALKRVVAESFPLLKGLDDAEVWSGLRSATPEGLPLIGRTAQSNLWMNIGQGSLGFTLAAGCATVLGMLIDNVSPTISLTGLSWSNNT